MKFNFEIINCKDSGSVYNVHIFAMYEGANSRQNMAKVLPKFSRDIEELKHESFSLSGHKIKIFLGVATIFLMTVYFTKGHHQLTQVPKT